MYPNAMKFAIEITCKEDAVIFCLLISGLKYSDKGTRVFSDDNNAATDKKSLSNIILEKTNAPIFMSHG